MLNRKIINHKFAWRAALAVVLSLALAGCGTQASTGANNDAAAGKDEKATIVKQGKVPVEGKPTKIAITDYRFADSLLALGIKPYAMGSYLGTTNLEWLDNKQLEGVINLGEDGNPEAVLAAKPDLIIAWENQAKQYENYSKIAPTLVIGETKDWKADFREFAGALGKSKEADAWLKTYEAKAKQAKTKLAPKITKDTTGLYFRIVGKEYRIHSDDQKLGRILYQDLSFQVPEKVKPIDRRETISLEALPGFDADYIFLEVGAPKVGGDKDAEQKLAELQQSSVWKNLKAVKNNHVIVVPYWADLDFPQANLKMLELVVDKALNPTAK